ncbi:MAG: glycogen/starch synthase [Flavobacteriales bacterium AspAUS03]
MTGKSILYISSALYPYSSETPLSLAALKAPKVIHARGNDVRIFMPRFGIINERRHQLHEVIRLSGINLIIYNMDQPLLIKVASIPDSRLQVYFIDNEEYFKRKAVYEDEDGQFFSDNDERALFFTKGVLEAVRKLNWVPDIIHVHGWLSALIPLYVKVYYKNDPIYQDTKIVASIYDQPFEGCLNKDIIKKVRFDGIRPKYLKHLEQPDFVNLTKLFMDFSDGVIKGDRPLLEEIETYIEENKIKVLEYLSVDEIALAYQQLFKEAVLEQLG